jgi:nucleoside-diphosphate kinase
VRVARSGRAIQADAEPGIHCGEAIHVRLGGVDEPATREVTRLMPTPVTTETRGSPVTERTLVLIKPDAVARGLVGEVIGRFERKGLTIDTMVLRVMDAALADRHYAEHVTKAFYPPLKEFMTSGPLVAMILSGDQAVEVVRGLVGATDGRKAAAGTIRGDLSLSNQRNLVHASDSVDSAAREIALWFPDRA